jgi:hypothetical protein
VQKTSLAISVFLSVSSVAQDSTNAHRLPAGPDNHREPGQAGLTVSAFADCYYAYDFDRPTGRTRTPIFYNYNRHDEVNLNLGVLGVSYNTAGVRGNVALMAGTYAMYNLASEPVVFRNVYEANAGMRISKADTWIDAGIMPSHIGFETVKSTDCWTLTRSIVADNSPYYETGARLSHRTADGRLYMALLYLNGWQRIQRLPGRRLPSVGSQLTWTGHDRLTLNWSAYAGDAGDVPARTLRQ